MEESRGLGDTITKLTRRMGMRPCSRCQKRREALNRFVPYRHSKTAIPHPPPTPKPPAATV